MILILAAVWGVFVGLVVCVLLDLYVPGWWEARYEGE